MQSCQYYIGLMSGTSMDGIDAVLAKLTGTRWQGVCAHAFIPYSENLKQKLLALQAPAHNELAQAAVLAQELAHLNAQAVSAVLTEADIEAQAIMALGCHGQTIRHAPEQHYSIQLMDWALLAELTGITTVGDFRSRDLAAGGQGAPLVPAFHQAVFASEQHSRVVLNLGGIANISVLQPQKPAFGFDTGPANMLMDAWVQHHWQQEFDYNGTLASQGQIIEPLLQAMLGHDYFSQPYPKSTGRDLFSLDWLNQYLTGQENPADVLRTLLELTAQTAVNAIINAAPTTNSVYACGGGSQNRLLMHTLAQLLKQNQISLHSTDNLQIPAQLVEAAAFAWLAACWYQRQPVATHHATGAAGARIPGCGYWA
ncbi:anhydro-N-acetylmuramic acid kinase [Snodgrassella sp. ESL0253]|uniref:anhydro-N-acetylmuramic acid kinase n=1 Tax=Snodgrassella sp. ESL0253 TaxID=2705031 RepID=UPI001581440A|nr:anhydro-N-acetylmuramic acid kinase [Snodgrassella sp. ESL0253]NUE67192.1 anhydro-N-acetylmuramic acid kinase [Snodgrassella sp. ESL0253]